MCACAGSGRLGNTKRGDGDLSKTVRVRETWGWMYAWGTWEKLIKKKEILEPSEQMKTEERSQTRGVWGRLGGGGGQSEMGIIEGYGWVQSKDGEPGEQNPKENCRARAKRENRGKKYRPEMIACRKKNAERTRNKESWGRGAGTKKKLWA